MIINFYFFASTEGTISKIFILEITGNFSKAVTEL